MTGQLHLQLHSLIMGVCAIALLDSGATGNFMDWIFMKKTGIPLKKKKQSYNLASFGEDKKISRVTKETWPLEVNTQGHREKMCFDVTKLESYDLILNYSWLKQHNPNIDWLEKKVWH